MVTAATNLKDTCSLEEKLWQTKQHIKKQRHYFANKGPSSQSYGFSRSHVWMWELDYKESWALKNWCFWTVVLETTSESPLDCKEIQPVHCKGNHSWYSLEGRMLKLKFQYFGHLMWRTDSLLKDPDAGKDWRWEEKGMTEAEMVGWHHQLDGHKFEQAPGVGDGQGGLECCSPWGHNDLDMTEWLNWIELIWEGIPRGRTKETGRVVREGGKTNKWWAVDLTTWL